MPMAETMARKIPGTMAAANRPKMDAWVAIEHTTKIPLGRINAPRARAADTAPARTVDEVPGVRSCGTEVRPMVAAVTMLDPHTAPNPAQAAAAAVGNPPGRPPHPVRATRQPRRRKLAR